VSMVMSNTFCAASRRIGARPLHAQSSAAAAASAPQAVRNPMRRVCTSPYLHTPKPYPGSSVAWSSSFGSIGGGGSPSVGACGGRLAGASDCGETGRVCGWCGAVIMLSPDIGSKRYARLQKAKRPSPAWGDGLRGTRLLVGCRLHHPGVVGTSMPTLIRTRVVAASDIHRIMPQLSVPEAEHSGRLFSSDVTVKAGRGVI
jgi:hypothetical protein